jgi:hypothetical protein
VKLVIVGCLAWRVAAADPPCGTGKPARLDLAEAAVDPHAFVIVGKVVATHVPPPQGFEGRTGTVDVDVQTVLRGAAVKRVTVPVASEKCIPKAACPATPLDIAQLGAKVIVACLPGRVEIVPAGADDVADAKRCIGLGTSAALAIAYVEGKQLARRCVATTLCDEHRRTEAVAGLVEVTRAPELAAEAKLDVGLVLVQAISAAASIIGCTTPPKLFRADLGGGDASNRLIARALLEGMLAAGDVNHRHRWANLVWDMFVEWYEHQEQWKPLLAKLGPLAAKATKQLRALGGPDGEHYETIAATIEAANRP